MKLTNKELQQYYYGAYSFEETEDGYLRAYQYTKAQMDYFKERFDFWYERCDASNAKTLEFRTDAEEFSLDYKLVWIGSYDTFEVAVDGLITDIFYLKDMDREGRLTVKLPAGEKNVIFYLPADSTAAIRNFETEGSIAPVTKGAKVLWIGDSITQGFGPLRSGCIYVSVANRLLNYDIINQGIGGYIYEKGSVMKMEGYTPDKIIVALGTNQFGCETMQDVEEFYEALSAVYGSDIPVLTVTPLWRGDHPESFDTLERFCGKVKEICSRYPNIKIVDGYTMVPHLPEYYLDRLHPNCLGAEIYGRNLVREIERLGF